MKRAIAWVWLVFCGLSILTVIVLTFFQPLTWHTLAVSGRAVAASGTLMAPSIRYLRRTPADRAKLREMKEADKRLDAIDPRDEE